MGEFLEEFLIFRPAKVGHLKRSKLGIVSTLLMKGIFFTQKQCMHCLVLGIIVGIIFIYTAPKNVGRGAFLGENKMSFQADPIKKGEKASLGGLEGEQVRISERILIKRASRRFKGVSEGFKRVSRVS